ncbi:hypothetical protein TNCT_659031 [Trichonephila clavata]|uniref:Uncharacterized protein n=1 Tax=Trichonephila clavata TaxID=2740835 RepID=A0A8X6KHK8_TRICU|nr:hypothetical protein TNCT_659031 [Trichonephila clavata]
MAKFSAEDKPPEIIRKYKDFDIENGHFDFKFHPYIVNQYVYSMFNESDGTPTPPIIWKITTSLCVQTHVPVLAVDSEPIVSIIRSS